MYQYVRLQRRGHAAAGTLFPRLPWCEKSASGPPGPVEETETASLISDKRPLTTQWLENSLADEGSPIVRIVRILLSDFLLRFLKCLRAAHSLVEEVLIELVHQILRRAVVDRPQADDYRFRSGDGEAARQAEHAFSDADHAQAGLARRQNREFVAREIHRRDVFGGDESIRNLIRHRIAGEPGVDPRQRENGSERLVRQLAPR